MKSFYNYIDSITFPRFSLYFANGGPIPFSPQCETKSFDPEDYIYIVYKYIQDNDKIEVDTMQRIRKFTQTKFRKISRDLDMSTVPVDEPAKLAKFYSDYASKIR